MVQAVLFDLDGTLFDDRQYVRAGLLNAAEKLEAETGVDISTELLTAYFDRGIRERTFDCVLREQGLSREIIPDLVDTYHAHDEALVPFPEAESVLSDLREEYNIGLITGGVNGKEKLRRLGLASYFEVVYVTAEHDTSKRYADPFEAVLADLEVTAPEAVYVGDRPALDFPQPNQLGMGTIRVLTGQFADTEVTKKARPDIVVNRLDELPSVIADFA